MQLFKGGLEAETIVPGPKTKHKQGSIWFGKKRRQFVY